MSTRTRSKRTAETAEGAVGDREAGVKATTADGKVNVDGDITAAGGSKRRGGRTTTPRIPIKIEIEEDDPNVEVSEYFKKEEAAAGSKAGVKKVGVGRGKSKDDTIEKLDALVEKGVPLKNVKLEEPSEESPSSSPSKKKKTVEAIKVEPPANWKEMLENIQIMRSGKTAAVDTMGCERTADLKEDPKVQRFHTLISLMLSSQTRDQVTFAAMERLKERKLNVETMLQVDEQELSEILKPVGFYKRKAAYIKKAAVILREKYDDDIPKTVEDLCALPGVGPKMAYICMNAAWHENAGIGVDTHVHRISNRLKWTGLKGTATPEKTREALESWLPKEMWQEINILLVGFGQEICLPIGPKCTTCLNKDICPSAEIGRSKKSKKK